MIAPEPKLTERQAEVYRDLYRFHEQQGRAPSYREACDLLGVASKQAVARYVESLERKGWIKREPGAYRGLSFLRSV